MRLVLAGLRALLVTVGFAVLAIVGVLLFVVLAVAIRPLLMLGLLAGVAVCGVLSFSARHSAAGSSPWGDNPGSYSSAWR